MTDVPPGFAESARGRPGGFIGERDVFDTWFTSSLTPDIATELAGTTLMPADLRPQSHDIIRTWAFYTIAKSELHHARKPWNHVMISGWILDPDRKKMSKSKGNVITPLHLLDEHGVDAVRYWAARARLGADTAFDPSLFKVGRRLVTKLFNAAKFVLGHEGASGPVTYELDRAFLFELSALCRTVTSGFDAFDYADALEKTESFFWNRFTDTYVELTKPRVWQTEDGEQPQRASALAALRLGLDVLLRLFAPVLPYITEEVWSWRFARERGCRSIHSARWPGEHDFVGVSAPKGPDVLALAGSCLRAINRAKSEAGASTGRILDSLVIAGNRATLAAASAVLDDAARAARCRAYELREDTEIEDGMFMATEPRFADRAPG
jgi:valyl-tRNA synthetase